MALLIEKAIICSRLHQLGHKGTKQQAIKQLKRPRWKACSAKFQYTSYKIWFRRFKTCLQPEQIYSFASPVIKNKKKQKNTYFLSHIIFQLTFLSCWQSNWESDAALTTLIRSHSVNSKTLYNIFWAVTFRAITVHRLLFLGSCGCLLDWDRNVINN